MENELIESMTETLIKNAYDIPLEWLNCGVDVLLETNGINSIPIVGTAVGIYKVSKSLYDRHRLKEIFEFLKSLKDEKVSEEELIKMRDNYEKSPGKFKDDVERILLLLERHLEKNQSKYLGKIVAAFFNNKIGNSDFFELSNINSQMTSSDFEIMEKELNILDFSVVSLPKYSHLVGLGILENEVEAMAGEINTEHDGYFGEFINSPEIHVRMMCKFSDLGALYKRICFMKFM